jgi:tetratricopeptide (TPR) repeat protein
VWIFEGIVEDETPLRRSETRAEGGRAPTAGSRASGRDASGPRSDRISPLPEEVVTEIAGAAGRERAGRVSDRLAAAAAAYRRDRYPEALRITTALLNEIPDSASARELHGLVCYRMGRWRQAISQLDQVRTLDGDDPSQIPVLMDCHRALGHHRRVRELWEELRAASPPADVLAEGRLVLAADMAERDEVAGAIQLLVEAGVARDLRRPLDRHIRQWYVLADLSERVGDLPRARELFARAAAADPDLADAAERAAALGRARSARAGGGPGRKGAKSGTPPRPPRDVTLGELSGHGRRRGGRSR